MAGDQELTGLIVKIRADLSDYVMKLAQMENQTSGSVKRTSEVWGKLGKLTLVAAGSVTTAAGIAVKSAIEWGNAVDDLSDKTGMAGEESSKFLVIAKRTGMDLQTANIMWARFSKSVFEAASAQTTAAASGKQAEDALTMLGISATNTDGTMRSASEIFQDIKNRLNEMPDGLQKTAIEMKLFGRSGAEMHDILMMSNSEMQKAWEKAKALGLIMSSETAAGYEQLKRDIESTKGTLSALGIAITTDALPTIKALLDSATKVTKAFIDWKNANPELASSLFKVAGGVAAIATAISGVTWAAGKVPKWAIPLFIAGGIPGYIGASVYLADKVGKQNAEDIQNGDYSSLDQMTRDLVASSGRAPKTSQGIGALKDIESQSEGYTPERKNQGDDDFLGNNNGGDSRTAFQVYKEETMNLIGMWQKQVDMEQLSFQDFAKNVQNRLTGLAKVAVLEKEKSDRDALQFDLEGKIFALGKQARQEMIEKAGKQVQLGEMTIDQYDELLKKLKEQTTSNKERLELALQIAAAEHKLMTEAIRNEDNLLTKKKATQSMQEETERHALEMAKINSEDTSESKKAIIDAETELTKKQLSDEYQLESEALAAKIRLYEQRKEANGRLTKDEKREYEDLLREKAALDAKYNLEMERANNAHVERVASQNREIVNSNRKMITDLITGTRSGTDVLEDMWYKFVERVVAKLFSVNEEVNIFSALFGGLFGISSGGSGGSGSSGSWTPIPGKASGGPVSANTPYLVGEVGPELFVPNTFGAIVPNSGLSAIGSSSQTVVLNQTFNGATDPAIVAQLKQQGKIIKSTVQDLLKNDPSTRGLVKVAAK
jgi:hypothetical protein